MSVRLSVGLTKKIGLPHYSSVGASCHVDIELDHAVLDQDLERFRQHVRRAYPPRGIQIKIRAYENDTKHVREVTVVHEFLQE